MDPGPRGMPADAKGLNSMKKTQVDIEARIAAKPGKVWTYWTAPEHIMKWNFASDDWHCPSASNDVKVGGKMNSRMEAKDGSFGFDFEAVYNEVVPEKKLVYTMPDGRQVITHFESAGDGTKVSTLFDAESENPVEMQKAGWQAILDNFKKYVETH
jgi:uncharacterized protein YndB with AHSA1/START domain